MKKNEREFSEHFIILDIARNIYCAHKVNADNNQIMRCWPSCFSSKSKDSTIPDTSAGKRNKGAKPDIGCRELIFIHLGEAGSQVCTL